MLTTVLELLCLVLIVAGAVAIVVGVASWSVPGAFVIGGVEGVGLGLGGLWISKRVNS